MNATRILGSVLVLSALGSFLTAQAPQGKRAKKQDGHPAMKEAAAKPETSRELAFNVTGLTAENLTKAKEGLQALSNHVFACDACKVEEATAGTCPKCKGALKSETHPIFTQIKPSAEAGTVQLTLEPKAMLRYSELEGALAKNMIHIDPARFTVPGRARLLVRGATAETSPLVEKALTDAKLFDEVKARFDPSTSELVVLVRAGATAPTRAKVTAALEGAKVQLTDIVWGPMLPKS